MSDPIDVLFYYPEDVEKKFEGKLYKAPSGRYQLESKALSLLRLAPKDIIYANSIPFNTPYTLVNCHLKEYAAHASTYVINECYKGKLIEKVTDETIVQVTAGMTHLCKWINQSRIDASLSYNIYEPGNVLIKSAYEETFRIGEGAELLLQQLCGEERNKQGLHLKELGFVKLNYSKPVSRLQAWKQMEAFLKFLSLFSDEVPRLTSVEYQHADGQPFHLTMPAGDEVDDDYSHPTYTATEIRDQLTGALERFYLNRPDFVSVLDLFNESRENKTTEVSFLNITTGLEVLHKEFYQDGNDDLEQKLRENLIASNLLSRKVNKKWVQAVRYMHLFQEISELKLYKNNVADLNQTVSLLTESRNYYTHYTKTKKAFWSPNQLVYKNRILREVLRALILKKIGLDTKAIEMITGRFAGAIYAYSYEANEYSINFKSKGN